MSQLVQGQNTAPNFVAYEAGERLNVALAVDNTPIGKAFVASIAYAITSVDSSAARYIDSANRIDTSEVKSGLVRTLLNAELRQIEEECAEDGWDTPTSKAVSKEVVQLSYNLITLIPRFSADPEIMAESDGAISFEWNNGAEYFILSVNPNDELYYICKLGGKKSRGCEDYSQEETRELLRFFLRRLYQ